MDPMADQQANELTHGTHVTKVPDSTYQQAHQGVHQRQAELLLEAGRVQAHKLLTDLV